MSAMVRAHREGQRFNSRKIHNQSSAWPQYPSKFCQHLHGLNHVLEDMFHPHAIEAFIGETHRKKASRLNSYALVTESCVVVPVRVDVISSQVRVAQFRHCQQPAATSIADLENSCRPG